jgi:hypothetical protein
MSWIVMLEWLIRPYWAADRAKMAPPLLAVQFRCLTTIFNFSGNGAPSSCKQFGIAWLAVGAGGKIGVGISFHW